MKAFNEKIILRNVAIDPSGGGKNLIAAINTPVAVYETGTTNLADIFDLDENPISNPTSTDIKGNVVFKVNDGVYDIVGGTGENETRWDQVEIIDLTVPLDVKNIKHYTLAEAKALTGAVIGQIIQITDKGNAQYKYVDSVPITTDEVITTNFSLFLLKIDGEKANHFNTPSEWSGSLIAEVGDRVYIKERSNGVGGGFIGDVVSGSLELSRNTIPHDTLPLTLVKRFSDVRERSQSKLNYLIAEMAAGREVNIGCFGDSTTDGVNTTGFTANPNPGNVPTGNTDHNLNAPNAWPAKLKSILQNIYSNTNIDTWNAGYSGMEQQNGWALANYDRAITDNPFYGIPDILIMQFGLNDVVAGGSQLDSFIEQGRLLVEKALGYGTLPVLMSCDPHYRTELGPFPADQKEVTRELDEAKKTIAKEYEIPFIDLNKSMKDWIQNNEDDYSWGIEQDDALHFGDNGHAFKGSFVASKLYLDMVVIGAGQNTEVNTWNSATSGIYNYSGVVRDTNNKQGGNPVFNLLDVSFYNSPLMTLWVWNEGAETSLFYNGLDDDFTRGSYTKVPSVRVEDMIENTVAQKFIISHGGLNPNFRRSDEHYNFGKLKYGLNKIEYLTGDNPSIYFGGFIFANSVRGQRNGLSKQGRFSRSYLASTGKHVAVTEKCRDMSNVTGGFDGDTLSISFNANIPADAGIILYHGRTYSTPNAIEKHGRNGLMLFRGENGKLYFIIIQFDDDGYVEQSLYALGETSTALPWVTNNFEGRVEITRETGQQRLRLFDGFSGGSEIISQLMPISQSVRWSGVVGGVHYDSDAGTPANATVEILEMVIN